MTARQAVRAEAGQPPAPPPFASSSFSGERTEQLGMAWWAQDQGAVRRIEEDEEEGVQPGDYATVAVCYGYMADMKRCPHPPYPENESLSFKEKNHLQKVVKGN